MPLDPVPDPMLLPTGSDDVYTFNKAIGQGSMGAVATITKRSNNVVHVLKTIQLTRMSKEFQIEVRMGYDCLKWIAVCASLFIKCSCFPGLASLKLRNEIALLMKLDHPNIVKPLEL